MLAGVCVCVWCVQVWNSCECLVWMVLRWACMTSMEVRVGVSILSLCMCMCGPQKSIALAGEWNIHPSAFEAQNVPRQTKDGTTDNQTNKTDRQTDNKTGDEKLERQKVRLVEKLYLQCCLQHLLKWMSRWIVGCLDWWMNGQTDRRFV